jgi:hypothetical protein
VQLLEVSYEYLVKHSKKSDNGGITFLNDPIQNSELKFCSGIFLESNIHDNGDGGEGFYEDSDDDSKYLEGETISG